MPLPDGAPAPGALSADDSLSPDGATYFETWHFQARAGERVRVTMESEDFDAYLGLVQLTDDDFITLEFDDDGGPRRNPRIDYTIPADGEYVLIATSYQPQMTGSYAIQLERR